MRSIVLLVAASLGGLLAAVLVGYAWRTLAPEITSWGVAAVVVLAGLGLWSKALFSPAHVAHRSMPIQKYLIPCAFSILGAMLGGLVGFSVGLLAASALMATSEFRMHDFMYHRTHGGAGEPGTVTAYCFVARTIAGAIIGDILWKQYGVEWLAVGSSRFAEMLSSSDASGMVTFAGLGAVFGFLYELAEHIAGAIYRRVG